MEYLKITSLQVNNKGTLFLNASNLSIKQQQKIGLIGINGSGKTTLLKIINNKPINMDIKGNIISHCKTFMVSQLLSHNKQSGGEKEKEAILSAIKRANQSKEAILLLDEPTANLDFIQQDWLVNTLNSFNHPVLVVSHDQAFLNEIIDTVWYIENNTVNEFKGTYAQYESKRRDDLHRAKIEYQLKKKKISELRNAQKELENKGHNVIKKKKSISWSDWKIKDSNKIEKKLLHSSKIINKKIDRELNQLRKPITRHPITLNNFKVSNLEVKAKDSLIRIEVQDICGLDKTLFKIGRNIKIKNGDKVILTGKNGCGKTVFLTKLADNQLNEWINPKTKIGFFTQDISNEIKNSEKVGEEIKKLSIFDVTTTRQLLGDLHLGKCLNTLVSNLSGGQLVCYKLAKILLGEHNMLILDEPDNFLDIASIKALIAFLKDYPFSIIIVTHDKKIINELNFQNWKICKGKLLLSDMVSKSPTNELDLLRHKLDKMIADTSVPISQVQGVSKRIMELEKTLNHK